MQTIITKLHQEAIKNELFNMSLTQAGEASMDGVEMPEGSQLQAMYATIYLGWLIGRKEFKQENYK